MAKPSKRQPLSPENITAEFEKCRAALAGESPLACAILGTAFLERALEVLMNAFFIDSKPRDSTDATDLRPVLPDVFDDKQGTLSQFASKVDLAFCLGLIASDMHFNLKRIGKMRNKFAHTHDAIDFHTDDEIRGWCESLRFPFIKGEDGQISDVFTHLFEESMKKSPLTGETDLLQEPRSRFITIASGLAVHMMCASQMVKRINHSPRK